MSNDVPLRTRRALSLYKFIAITSFWFPADNIAVISYHRVPERTTWMQRIILPGTRRFARYLNLSLIYHLYVLFVTISYQARFCLQILYPEILFAMLNGVLSFTSFCWKQAKCSHCQFSCQARVQVVLSGTWQYDVHEIYCISRIILIFFLIGPPPEHPQLELAWGRRRHLHRWAQAGLHRPELPCSWLLLHNGQPLRHEIQQRGNETCHVKTTGSEVVTNVP